MKFFSLLFAFLFALHTSCFACTRILWNNNPIAVVSARSVDLFTSDLPMIVAEPRKTKHDGEAGENSLVWQAKYGVLAVTAFHSHAVTDGMNEKGLVAHLLYLSGTKYPDIKKNKPSISNLMWAEYILDNFATVAEALTGIQDLQIIPTKVHGQTWPIHLAMEDATGDSAIIEYVNGKMQIYHGKQYQIMTNEPAYHLQLSNLKRYQGFGGKLSLPGDPDPLSRFVRAATFLKTLPTPQNYVAAIAGVLSVMRTVQVPFGAVDTSGNKTEDAWATRWVSVADATNKVYYFTSTSAPNLIWFDLNKINFTETNNPPKSMDPTEITLGGDVTQQLIQVIDRESDFVKDIVKI